MSCLRVRSNLIVLHNMFVESPLILESSVTVWKGTLKLLLLHHVHGAGAEEHGAAPADVRLVRLKHDVGAAPVPKHYLGRKSLDQYLGNVLPVGPGNQLLLRNALAY